MVLKWGIASCGRISNDFVVSLNNISEDEQKIVAVAARDKGRANDFALKHRICTAYGSYEELAADNNIDVVYVCMLNTQHFAVSKLMLENCKHVLCEKPLCMNYKQSKELIEIAKSKGLFLMEAVWSRFFPVYYKLRKSLEDNVIGDILQVTVNFGIAMKNDRVTQKDLGGSIVLDIGVYTLQFASLVFGRKTPYEIVSLGHLNDDKVDESYSCIIKYPKGKTAASVVHGRVKMDNDAYIYGTSGFIKIHQPFWCPTKITVNDKLYEFPLPENDEGVYNHVNSAGLHYEAKEVYKCIKEGAQESSIMSFEDSLLIAKQADTIRSQLGSVFDVDS